MAETQPGSLTIIVGMPGAGKTTLLGKLLASGEIDSYYDDYQRGALEDDKSNPRKSPNYTELSSDIEAGRRIAIADIRYCVPGELEIVQRSLRDNWPELAIIVHFFENNIVACRHNILQRAREGYVESELQYIDQHSPYYQPSTVDVLPVIMG